MLEPRGSDDESEDEEDDDDDEEMYDDEYGDELEYGEEEISDDGDNGISDDDDEELGEMVPLNGFKELEGMNGVSRFNIHRDYGNKERLPSSHTCFN
ncbi:hypothetical protein BN1723_017455, partial [Verticillium longisporum]